ncbi:hypothetical protein LPJ61_001331 [Coemansia biformis]|uniref:AB hydrolase-1 domain-containing protein n=1 Tax=Coemansia biformis TaxID=1286918 RepID=A0A9W7YF36_9FUNG|nr:hypothetical protein LPJ61_001331 [Coemansia biformis]
MPGRQKPVGRAASGSPQQLGPSAIPTPVSASATHHSQDGAQRLASSGSPATASDTLSAAHSPSPQITRAQPLSGGDGGTDGSPSPTSSFSESQTEKDDGGRKHDGGALSRSRSRVFLEKLGLPAKRRGTTATPASSGDSAFSSGGASTSPETEASAASKRQLVSSMIAEYRVLSDREQCGFVDASRVYRRLGVGRRRVEKCDLYYEVFGTGPKKLFLIMGMVGSTMFWRLQTRYFSHLGDYTVCVFDNRGSGRSTIAPGPYKISRMANDAFKVLDHLGWHEDIHMVGISLGGMVAQEMCLLHDEAEHTGAPRFTSVVFVDTWHSSALAVPTVKEIKFAFNNMAALGRDPRHLIDLVFPRNWVHRRFHDPVKEVELRAARGTADEVELPPPSAMPSNKEVLTELFCAIQEDLLAQRAADQAQDRAQKVSPPAERTVTGVTAVSPSPADSTAASPPSAGSASGEPPAMRHAQTSLNIDGTQLQDMLMEQSHHTDGADKRGASGDIHQFMACLGHQLSPQRVQKIRTRNPKTRFYVVHGEKDRVIRPRCGRALAKHLRCPLIWIPGAGHMSSIDAHCTFNLVLRAVIRNERWLRELPDRTRLTPASWDEQVRVYRWIDELSPAGHSNVPPVIHHQISLHVDNQANRPKLCSDEQEPSKPPEEGNGGGHRSWIDSIHLLGPLPQELLFIDEEDPDALPRVIPSTTKPDTLAPEKPAAKHSREMIIYGALLDAPLRIRHYAPSAPTV